MIANTGFRECCGCDVSHPQHGTGMSAIHPNMCIFVYIHISIYIVCVLTFILTCLILRPEEIVYVLLLISKNWTRNFQKCVLRTASKIFLASQP